MLHGRPGPTALPTESVNRRGPGMLPESSRPPADAVTSLQDWQPCICESEVLPRNPTFEETGGEEPGTIRDNRHPRHALCYSPPPTTIPRGPPHVPCLPTQTHLPEPLPTQRTTPLPIELNGEMEYKLSEILDSKLDHCFKTGDMLHYLICWVGYEGMDEETSWVAASNLANSPDLCTSFHQWYPQKPRPHTKC